MFGDANFRCNGIYVGGGELAPVVNGKGCVEPNLLFVREEDSSPRSGLVYNVGRCLRGAGTVVGRRTREGMMLEKGSGADIGTQRRGQV